MPQADHIFHSTFFTLLSLTFFIIVLTSVRQDGSLGLLPALSNAGVRWLGNCVRGARFVLGAAAPQNLVLDLFSSLLCLLFAFYSASRCRRTIRLPFTGLWGWKRVIDWVGLLGTFPMCLVATFKLLPLLLLVERRCSLSASLRLGEGVTYLMFKTHLEIDRHSLLLLWYLALCSKYLETWGEKI